MGSSSRPTSSPVGKGSGGSGGCERRRRRRISMDRRRIFDITCDNKEGIDEDFCPGNTFIRLYRYMNEDGVSDCKEGAGIRTKTSCYMTDDLSVQECPSEYKTEYVSYILDGGCHDLPHWDNELQKKYNGMYRAVCFTSDDKNVSAVTFGVVVGLLVAVIICLVMWYKRMLDGCLACVTCGRCVAKNNDKEDIVMLASDDAGEVTVTDDAGEATKKGG